MWPVIRQDAPAGEMTAGRAKTCRAAGACGDGDRACGDGDRACGDGDRACGSFDH